VSATETSAQQLVATHGPALRDLPGAFMATFTFVPITAAVAEFLEVYKLYQPGNIVSYDHLGLGLTLVA
jgi:hypothetical protein